MGLNPKGRLRTLFPAFVLVMVIFLHAISVTEAAKKGGNTILLFLGEAEESRDEGSMSDEDVAPSESSIQADSHQEAPEWDEFGDNQDSQQSDEDLDPGSWSQVLEQPSIWDVRNKEVSPTWQNDGSKYLVIRMQTLWQAHLMTVQCGDGRIYVNFGLVL